MNHLRQGSSSLPLTIAFLVSAATAAHGASTVIHDLSGEVDDDRFGERVVAMGLVDGDGVPDFAVSAPEHDGPAGADAGRVYLFSGATGALVRTWDGAAVNARAGSEMIAGDFDGDATADIAFISSSLLNAYSGATGSALWSFDPDFNLGIATIGDLNGDGRDDFAIRGSNEVQIRTGLDGSILSTIPEPDAQATFGAAIAGTGDLDGDNIPDIAIGEPNYPPGLDTWGRVYVHSGSDNSLLYTVESLQDPARAPGFGSAIAAIGDVNGDSVPDFAAGTSAGAFLDGNREIGVVEVVSGIDGGSIERLDGLPDAVFRQGFQVYSWRFGSVLAGGGDVDGDGVPDLLVGNPTYTPLLNGGNGGKAYVFSGADRALVSNFPGTLQPGSVDAETRLGTALAILGDLDGDSRADIAVSEPVLVVGGPVPGRVRIYSVDPCPDLDGDYWVPCEGDCNDGDAFFSPITRETCNGFDDNCSGAADEDFDGDGYAPCLGDCDEMLHTRNIGWMEFPDGVDNNCNGVIDLCGTLPRKDGPSSIATAGAGIVSLLGLIVFARRRRGRQDPA